MSEPERRICRYFNTLGGCWFGDKCKFLHVPNKKPPCKFFGSSTGCRFGENCHFSHDRTAFKSLENYEDGGGADIKEDFKENLNPSEQLSGTNNNNMEQNNSNSNNALESFPTSSPCNEIIPRELSSSPPIITITNDSDIRCGSCKKVLERQGDESYCNLLKAHYLESFLDKESDHVKYVKFKAGLEPGQMYSCKTCILIFEKPWSLFQHMADKARGIKVQRWDKKIHTDWLDTVAGVMAGYDLGLFSPGKLRSDLRNLLADQHAMEEEMEAAAATATALMQWMTPMNANPWRNQQRDVLRMIELFNRQMHRKGGGSRSIMAPSISNGAVTGRGRGRGASRAELNNPFIGSGSTSNTPIDMNFGFSEEEVNELLTQGIKPWDEEAGAALAALHGEFDYLLE